MYTADQGHAIAQFNLGTMYYHGRGVEQSFTKAKEWLTKAAAQGDQDAIKHLASALFQNDGVDVQHDCLPSLSCALISDTEVASP